MSGYPFKHFGTKFHTLPLNSPGPISTGIVTYFHFIFTVASFPVFHLNAKCPALLLNTLGWLENVFFYHVAA